MSTFDSNYGAIGQHLPLRERGLASGGPDPLALITFSFPVSQDLFVTSLHWASSNPSAFLTSAAVNSLGRRMAIVFKLMHNVHVCGIDIISPDNLRLKPPGSVCLRLRPAAGASLCGKGR